MHDKTIGEVVASSNNKNLSGHRGSRLMMHTDCQVLILLLRTKMKNFVKYHFSECKGNTSSYHLAFAGKNLQNLEYIFKGLEWKN